MVDKIFCGQSVAPLIFECSLPEEEPVKQAPCPQQRNKGGKSPLLLLLSKLYQQPRTLCPVSSVEFSSHSFAR